MKVLLAENYFPFSNDFWQYFHFSQLFNLFHSFGPISLEAHSFDFSDENADG